MPRLKFVATAITRASGEKGSGFKSVQASTSAIYLESNAVEIGPAGAGTYFIDKVTNDQYISAKAYSAVITALDTASSSPQNAIDLT
jgi:hypothetical protein